MLNRHKLRDMMSLKFHDMFGSPISLLAMTVLLSIMCRMYNSYLLYIILCQITSNLGCFFFMFYNYKPIEIKVIPTHFDI